MESAAGSFSSALLSGSALTGSDTGNFDRYRVTEKEKQHDTNEWNTKTLPESISWRVSKSWSLLEDRLEEVGCDFFMNMFDENPSILHLFHFASVYEFSVDENTGERILPAQLRAHAVIVMQTLGNCVSGGTQLSDVVPKLRSIGAVHKRVGVQDYHYSILFKHLADAIARALGPEHWDGETREAWELVFRSLTSVIKRPNELFQMEPLEGWGLVNAGACAYIAFFTPFRMAGFTASNETAETVFNVLTVMSIFCCMVDMLTFWLAPKLAAAHTFPNLSNRSPLRRTIDRFVFPVRFRTMRYLRSLQMERWSSWPTVDALILLSFPLQYFGRLLTGFAIGHGSAGVHWTFIFGFLRLAAGARVVNYLQCAENNLMMRRHLEDGQRSYIRIIKLILTMLTVMHVSACLWCVVARIELGPYQVEPKESTFFPNAEYLLGRSGVMNSYLHTLHWAWVNLAGIGDCESTPVTNFECLVTLLVHFCGITLHTITVGNVVSILESMTQQSSNMGADLAELGEFMHSCHISAYDQKRIMEGYMIKHLMKNSDDEFDGDKDSTGAPKLPDAVKRLPAYLREELVLYARAEAIKHRDPAFVHTNQDFLFAIVGGLKQKHVLLAGDFFFEETDTIPEQVIFVESGKIDVLSGGKCVRTLQRGDVIGKRWLLTAGQVTHQSATGNPSFQDKTSLRAHTECVLLSGLTSAEDIVELRSRYPKDFVLLRADRERINEKREARRVAQDRKHHRSHRRKAASAVNP